MTHAQAGSLVILFTMGIFVREFIFYVIVNFKTGIQRVRVLDYKLLYLYE